MTDAYPPNDLCFMDTETLGLHPEAPVWEFAAIRRAPSGAEQQFHCFIDHYPFPWADDLPKQFLDDYRARYDPEKAIRQWDAVAMIRKATAGATIVGAVPNFDTERLARMRRRVNPADVEDCWHYHLVDVENLIVGYIAGGGAVAVPPPPWSSNDLSLAVGVDPELFDRHTAMGDVLWVRAQYDRVMGVQA